MKEKLVGFFRFFSENLREKNGKKPTEKNRKTGFFPSLQNTSSHFVYGFCCLKYKCYERSPEIKVS